MNLPIIKLEVTGMHHAVQVALSEHQVAMDQYVNDALERYCSPDNIRAVVDKAATQAIDAAVKECINHFFRYGTGRRHIKDAVEKHLALWEDE